MSESKRYSGQVKWFNKKAGYGFITCTNSDFSGKDIFVHYRSLNNGEHYKYLIQGEYVEFSIGKPEKDNFEHTAINITGVNGGKIICETKNEPPRKPRSRESRKTDSTQGDNNGAEFTKVNRKYKGNVPKA
jgi:CspA family cold shock protein